MRTRRQQILFLNSPRAKIRAEDQGREDIESEVTAEQKRREKEEEKVMAFPCQGVMGTPIRREDQHLLDLHRSAGEGFAVEMALKIYNIGVQWCLPRQKGPHTCEPRVESTIARGRYDTKAAKAESRKRNRGERQKRLSRSSPPA